MKVSVEIAQEKFEQLIERALFGEEVLIYLNKRDVVKLEPIDDKVEEKDK